MTDAELAAVVPPRVDLTKPSPQEEQPRVVTLQNARQRAEMDAAKACALDKQRCRQVELTDEKLGIWTHCSARIYKKGVCATHHRRRLIAGMHRAQTNAKSEYKNAKRLGLDALEKVGKPRTGRQWKKVKKQVARRLKQQARHAATRARITMLPESEFTCDPSSAPSSDSP